jgi:exodeoxyribonuclease-3
VRLLSYNIRHGGRGREPHLASVIASCSPDLVVLQEAVEPAVVERLATETSLPHWKATAGHSLAYISRIPVVDGRWHHPWGLRRALLDITLPDVDLRVFGVHLSAVHSWWTERRRGRELKLILQCMTDAPGLHVVVGDFNTLAPGEQLDVSRLPARLRALVWLSGGRIRWQTIQLMLEAGYIDGFRVLHPREDGSTFPTWDPHVRLDYVFLPGPYASRLAACDVVRGARGVANASDHLPLFAQLAT